MFTLSFEGFADIFLRSAEKNVQDIIQIKFYICYTSSPLLWTICPRCIFADDPRDVLNSVIKLDKGRIRYFMSGV